MELASGSDDWLEQQVKCLLDMAMKDGDPDHQACAKYCELLYKMGPRTVKKTDAADLAQRAREALKADREAADQKKDGSDEDPA